MGLGLGAAFPVVDSCMKAFDDDWLRIGDVNNGFHRPLSLVKCLGGPSLEPDTTFAIAISFRATRLVVLCVTVDTDMS